MRHMLNCCLLVTSISVFCDSARGHFVWLDVAGNERGNGAVEVYFSETADPGEPHLVEKIARTKVSARASNDAASEAIPLKQERDELSGKLVGPAPPEKSYRLDAVCDYGVVDKGGRQFLLKYYASHIKHDPAQPLPKFGDLPQAPLGVHTEATSAGFTCNVHWNGKPLKNADVVIVFPGGDSIERKTDERGQVEIKTTAKGKFAVRAVHVESEKSGEQDGKKYSEVRHYATLTYALGESRPAVVSQSTTAAELLRSARKSRAVWDDFPGFTADLVVNYNDETAAGKITITGDGEVALRIPNFSGSEWLQTYMESVVQHRMPGDPEDESVRYVDENIRHPLGRKIALGDGQQDSVYRIADNVVREVNRKAGPGRFTISVLEVQRNKEGKYLPLVYSMSFWNGGEKVTSTSTTQDSWVRVGGFDLPLRTMQVTVADDRRDVKLLEFSNHVLATPVAAAGRE